MHTNLLIVLAILSGVTNGFLGPIHRVILRDRTVDWLAYAGLWSLLASLFFLPAVLATHSFVHLDVDSIARLGLGVIVWLLVALFSFKSHQLVEVTLGTALSQSRVPFSLLFAVWLLGEQVDWSITIGALIVTLGMMFVAHVPGTRWGELTEKGVWLKLLTGCLVGLSIIVDKYALDLWPSGVYGFLTFLLPGLALTTYAVTQRKALSVLATFRAKLSLIILSGMLGMGYYWLELLVLSEAQASWVAVVNKVAIPVSFFVGWYVLKELTNLRWRVGGSILIAAGALTAVFG